MSIDDKSIDQKAVEEFARRQDGEMEKAIAKYGEVALSPIGHPDYDIFDYLINELVGLKRYGEMVSARAELMRQTDTISRDEMMELKNIGAACVVSGVEFGVRLIAMQQRLRARGLLLGTPEKSYKNDAKPETVREIGGSSVALNYKSRRNLYE